MTRNGFETRGENKFSHFYFHLLDGKRSDPSLNLNESWRMIGEIPLKIH